MHDKVSRVRDPLLNQTLHAPSDDLRGTGEPEDPLVGARGEILFAEGKIVAVVSPGGIALLVSQAGLEGQRRAGVVQGHIVPAIVLIRAEVVVALGAHVAIPAGSPDEELHRVDNG